MGLKQAVKLVALCCWSAAIDGRLHIGMERGEAVAGRSVGRCASSMLCLSPQ